LAQREAPEWIFGRAPPTGPEVIIGGVLLAGEDGLSIYEAQRRHEVAWHEAPSSASLASYLRGSGRPLAGAQMGLMDAGLEAP